MDDEEEEEGGEEDDDDDDEDDVGLRAPEGLDEQVALGMEQKMKLKGSSGGDVNGEVEDDAED